MRRTARRLVRLALLSALTGLIWQQLWLYRSEPLDTTTSRRQAPFPRLTICPHDTPERALLVPALLRLANGSDRIGQFYDAVTLKLRNAETGIVDYQGDTSYFSSEDRDFGVWREKYYHVRRGWSLTSPATWETLNHSGYTRCITFFASERMNANGHRDQPVRVMLQGPRFRETGPAFRLYVHGAEVPNVGDLPDWAPSTENVPLFPGKPVHYVITARRTERVSVRRRPCSSRPGYSVNQCLKECQWRQLAMFAGCRLPHMVGADAFLPKMEGFMEQLPLCTRLLTEEKWSPLLLPDAKEPSCMWHTREFNMTEMWEDYERFLREHSHLKEQLVSFHSRVKPSPTEYGTEYRVLTAEQNTTLSSSQRPIATPSTSLPVLAKALVKLPSGVSSINPSSCGCPLTCHEYAYGLSPKNTFVAHRWNPCAVFLTIIFDFTEEITQETLAVSLTDVLAHIGSFVGLFTGFSLYTFAGYIEESLVSLHGNMKIWKTGRKGRETDDKQRTSTSPDIVITDLDI